MLHEEMIHVALAFCDPRGTYARHAAVTMASLFENTKSSVCIHILHDETLTDDNKAAFKELASKYEQNLVFHDIESLFEEKNLDVSRLTLDGARGTLFRLLMPDVLRCDKVIYLDCDIVVTLDIQELWNVPIDNYAIAAVRDVWSLAYIYRGTPVPHRLHCVWNILGVSDDAYFNAGMLVMNLEKIRKEYDFLKKVEEFYFRFRKCITLADQDCLNWIFAKDALLIDEKFNHIDFEGVTEGSLKGSIWHMAGGSAKPWNLCTRPLLDDLYWQYLRKTPYCKNEKELIRLMLHDLSSSKCMHQHSGDCVKRLKTQMADNIFRAHAWTWPHILWKQWVQKLSLRG